MIEAQQLVNGLVLGTLINAEILPRERTLAFLRDRAASDPDPLVSSILKGLAHGVEEGFTMAAGPILTLVSGGRDNAA